jgi:hypothetical protein
MKKHLIKFICFFTGADHRKFFPEKWDLSKVKVWKQYGGNDGFVIYYNSHDRFRRFVNGIDVEFYEDTFVVKRIVGWTHSGFCSIAMNKKALVDVFRKN